MSPRRAKVLGGESSPGALRRHLIAATQHLLALHGAAGLTTRQIAHEAQVADGVLYNHFAGKDDLVLTALAEQAADLVRTFLDAVPEPGAATLDENLDTLAHVCLDFQAELMPLVTGLFGRPEMFHALLTAIHDEPGPQATFTATVDYLRAEQALGRVCEEVDARAVAEVVFGTCQYRALTGLISFAHQGAPDPAPLSQTDLTAVVAVLRRALRPAS